MDHGVDTRALLMLLSLETRRLLITQDRLPMLCSLTVTNQPNWRYRYSHVR